MSHGASHLRIHPRSRISRHYPTRKSYGVPAHEVPPRPTQRTSLAAHPHEAAAKSSAKKDTRAHPRRFRSALPPRDPRGGTGNEHPTPPHPPQANDPGSTAGRGYTPQRRRQHRLPVPGPPKRPDGFLRPAASPVTDWPSTREPTLPPTAFRPSRKLRRSEGTAPSRPVPSRPVSSRAEPSPHL